MEIEKSKQDKIKELFPKYVGRLTVGCKRLKCRNPNCCKNPNVKKLEQNVAAALAIKLVQNQEILNLNLCSDQEDPEPLTIDQLKEIFNQGLEKKNMDEWNTNLSKLFSNYNTLQYMFLENSMECEQASDNKKEDSSKIMEEEEVKKDEEVQQIIKSKNIPESGIDFKALEEFYSMVLYKDDEEIMKKGKSIIEHSYLQGMKLLKRDQITLDSIEELRFAVIFLAYPNLFDDPQGDVYQLFLEVINDINSQGKEYLANWVSQIFNKTTFEATIQNLKNTFAFLFIRLEEGSEYFEEQFQKYATNICQYFKIFFEANKIKPLGSNDLFVYEDLQNYIDPKREYIEHYNVRVIKKQEMFSFVDYTFLMNVSLKQQFLEIENEVEQKMSSRRQNGPDGLIRNIMGINLNLVLKVRRNNLLNDTLDQLIRPDQNYKLQLKVVFDGEQGIDEGGVQKEFFQLLTKQLFNLDFGMFVHKNKDTFHWFNGDYDDMPLYFELVGIILGLAIYNNILSDIKFPKVIYKKLLGQETHISDIQEFDPVLYKHLTHILNYDESEGKLEDSMITFQVSYNQFYMDRTYDLVPNGAEVTVNNQNKQQYVSLYTDWYLNKHIEKQYNSFQKGFYRVTQDSQFLKALDNSELQQICIGCETYDFTQLKKNTKYADGYTPGSDVVKWFWELLLDEFNLEQQKRFLFFLSGSDRAPVQGLQRIKMIIVRQAGEQEKLPSSSTCFNHLFIPEYPSKEVLKQKLSIAMENAEGFGLL